MERKKFTTTLNAKLLRKIKVLAAEKDTRTNELIEEAMRDLLKKYEKNTKK